MNRNYFEFCISCSVPFLVVLIATLAQPPARAGIGPEGHQNAASLAARVWPSDPPADIPFPRSLELTGIIFTGRHAQYTAADTWYPSWAADGNLYSPWADGNVNGVSADANGPKATTGYATIRGNDPLHLTITDAGTFPADGSPYASRYPAGSLVYQGIWYYGTYCLDVAERDVLGPFVGFRYSSDHGRTWHETSHTPLHPLFPEPDHVAGKVKIGVPHFVDFGQEMQHSPDGMAYLVAQGASGTNTSPREPDLSWITADAVYLLRVRPGIDNMDRESSYEFFAGYDGKGRPAWSHDFSRIQPLITWNNRMGSVTMTYDPPLKKYLLVVSDGATDDRVSPYSTYILESNQISGPWKLVVYMKDFGEQAYFVNFPSRFISSDGRTLWMSYSANPNGRPKSDPPGSGYWWTLQEVRLLEPGSAGDK